MNFYDRYISLCNSVGKTPSAVAIEIGLAKPTVTRWKNGSMPNDATAAKIADYFHVSTEYLLSTEKATSDTGGGEVPHEQYREVLAGHGIRLLLDADAKVTMEQLNDIVDYINFQQRKNNR